VITDETRAEMRRILGEIQDGTFAKEWIGEADAGFPEFLRMRREARASQLESVGRDLRRMMPWLESERKVPPT
jgi:ketol-acid reductoisomerase